MPSRQAPCKTCQDAPAVKAGRCQACYLWTYRHGREPDPDELARLRYRRWMRSLPTSLRKA